VLISQGVPQLGGHQTTVRWQKHVFIHTQLSRAYLALARLLDLIRNSISELPRPIAVQFCHMISICVNFIMQVQKFREATLKSLGPKTCKIWHVFTQLQSLIANIFGTRQYIQNRKDMWSRTILL